MSKNFPRDQPVLLAKFASMSEAHVTPLAVSDGFHGFMQDQDLLYRGADKVAHNSDAIERLDLINQLDVAFGPKCVVVSLDARSDGAGGWRVWADGGRSDSGREALAWALEAVQRGAGEVLATSIDRDGIGEGLDLPLIQALAEGLSVPLIAAGGCGLAQHFVEGYQAGAVAVAAGTFFCQRDQNPMQCRSHVHNAKFPIRLAL